MIKLSRLTDYGIVLMTFMARDRERPLHTARDLAAGAKLPLPTVSKILKGLLQGGLLVSHRGTRGGYSLSRDAQDISVAEIITVLEGPIGMTECSGGNHGMCDLEPHCPITSNWQVISSALREALEKVKLADLICPINVIAARGGRNVLVPLNMISGRTQ